MFESAELGHKIAKEVWDREVPPLREALLDAQFDLSGAKFPVVILVAGVDGAGKSETVNTLNEWMDPRHIQTHGLAEPSDEERERPHMYRYWRLLPPKGKIGIFDGSWYTWPILERTYGRIKTSDLDQDMARVARFEQMLIHEGALVLKFWMHLGKDVQKKRLQKEGDFPVPHYWAHVCWVWGAKDIDDFMRIAEDVHLDGVVEKIRVPFLVTHGEKDSQIPLKWAHRTYEQLVNSPKRELKVFTDREGGVEHVGADNMEPPRSYIADWVVDRFAEM